MAASYTAAASDCPVIVLLDFDSVTAQRLQGLYKYDAAADKIRFLRSAGAFLRPTGKNHASFKCSVSAYYSYILTS